MLCPVVHFGVSMGSVCLWAVRLALAFLDMSISAAMSKWPSQHIFMVTSPLLVPGIFASASVSGSHPALHHNLAWASLSPTSLCCVLQGFCICLPLFWLTGPHSMSQGLCAHHRACVYLPQLLGPALCIEGLVCTCLASAGPPSMPWGLCVLLSAPWVCPMQHTFCVLLKDDAVKVLHSIRQQIWKTQQWPQD